MGQSTGALTLFALFRNHPEITKKIDTAIFVSPMGLIDGVNIADLAKRQFKEIKRDSAVEKSEERKDINKRVSKAFSSFIKGSPLRAFKEIRAIASSNDYDVLHLLSDNGVNVGIIQGAEDLLADSGRLYNMINKGYESAFTPIEPGSGKPGQRFEYRSSNQQRPPINNLRQPIKGGHEILGPRKFAGTVLRTLDRLRNPITKEQAIKFIQESHAQFNSENKDSDSDKASP